jgi:hypothetical protein
MPKSKVTVPYEVEEDQRVWLENMAKQHDLPNPSKALRVLLDHAIEEGDEREIFGKVRCLRCG